MKRYWTLVLLFYLLWLMISHQYPEPSWWSIFTSDRSTHTPLTEHISLVKISFTVLIFLGVAYFLNRVFQHRN